VSEKKTPRGKKKDKGDSGGQKRKANQVPLTDEKGERDRPVSTRKKTLEKGRGNPRKVSSKKEKGPQWNSRACPGQRINAVDCKSKGDGCGGKVPALLQKHTKVPGVGKKKDRPAH